MYDVLTIPAAHAHDDLILPVFFPISTAVTLSWDLYVSNAIGCTPASVFTADF